MRRASGEGNFSIVPQSLLNHPTISWAAKGLQSHLLQHAENWEIRTEHLVDNYDGGRDFVRKLIGELMLYGYITRQQMKTKTGQFSDIEFIVHRTPVDIEQRTLPKGLKRFEKKEALVELINFILLAQKNTRIPKTEIQASAKTPNPETSSPEMPSPADPTLTIISNNKNKKEQTTNTLSVVEFLIKDSLTENQKLALISRCEELTLNSVYTQEQWLLAIEAALLDKELFTNAQQKFEHKLNTILKQASLGHWSPAEYLALQQEYENKQKKQKANAQELEISKLRSEIAHLQRLNALKPSELLEKQINAAQAKLSELEMQYKAGSGTKLPDMQVQHSSNASTGFSTKSVDKSLRSIG